MREREEGKKRGNKKEREEEGRGGEGFLISFSKHGIFVLERKKRKKEKYNRLPVQYLQSYGMKGRLEGWMKTGWRDG